MFAKIISLLKKHRISLLIVVVAIGCGLCLFNYMSYSSKTEGYASQLGNELVLFTMNGCGHCENMMPAWNLLVKNYGSDNAYIDYKRVIAQEEPSLIEKYNVQSFPTILALKDGEIAMKYKGDRSYEDLLRFSNHAMTEVN